MSKYVCRDQIRGQLKRLYEGCAALCRTVARPEADLSKLQQTQKRLTGELAEVESFRGRVTTNVTSLTMKADEVMRRVPELEDQLDRCVQVITVRLEYIPLPFSFRPAFLLYGSL